MSSGPVLHFCQVPSKYSKGYLSYRADTKSFLNKTKGDNSKSKKGRVVILLHMSSGSVLHFYQVSSKYSKGYSSYIADKKFYADADADTDADANGIGPKNNMSRPPLVGGVHNDINSFIVKRLEKSHKLHPFPDTKRKRKQTKPNKRKSNKRRKSTKISSLFPKQGNRNAQRTEKHKNKISGKT